MFSQVLRFEHVAQFITLGMVDGVAVLVLLCFLSTGVLVNINNFAFNFRFPLSLSRTVGWRLYVCYLHAIVIRIVIIIIVVILIIIVEMYCRIVATTANYLFSR